MFRNLIGACLVLFGVAGVVRGDDWARGMFGDFRHDFGTVARAARSEHEFSMRNKNSFEVHVASVRASCGCTTPKIVKETIAPGEDGGILAIFNTRNFLGQRHATITVTFDRPSYAEVQLQIDGFVRRDVVLDPSEVQFGSVSVGSPAERTVKINYAGRSDWKIVDVLSESSHLEAELSEPKRNGGSVSYDLTVRLKDGAPAGYLNDNLVIVTNDSNQWARQLPVAVSGRVEAALAVTPTDLFIGEVSLGQRVSRQVVVRGKEPFQITQIDCGGQSSPVAAHCGKQSQKLHVVNVVFRAEELGDADRTIVVHTNLPGHEEVTFRVFGKVLEPAAALQASK